MIKIYTFLFVMMIFAFAGCEDFVDLDAPRTQIVSSTVFSNDAGARASILGTLSQMMNGSAFASGALNSITVVAGMSADELNNHSTSQDRIAIYNNSLSPLNNAAVALNWSEIYSTVYRCNASLEGASSSSTLSENVRSQVIGEALFLRAFCYFYLTNLYGDVPLLLSTDYRVNKDAQRTRVDEIYVQIEQDLVEARELLLNDYSFSNGEKTEPNRWAAMALLARTYLYNRKWLLAEGQASEIIDSEVFALEADLNSVFLMNSTEAIWQLMPVLPGVNTNEAPYLIIVSNPTRVSLTNSVMSVFEPADQRPQSWIGIYQSGPRTYNFPYKYKIRLRDEPLTEYYTVLRLAEQYLIRAEARAFLNKLNDAVDDINVIRTRAGLDPLDAFGMTQSDVLDAIAKERRSELFCEWGHRWFDLKRSGTIDTVLGPIKPDWQSKDALFPIPQAEINANPNLIQNP